MMLNSLERSIFDSGLLPRPVGGQTAPSAGWLRNCLWEFLGGGVLLPSGAPLKTSGRFYLVAATLMILVRCLNFNGNHCYYSRRRYILFVEWPIWCIGLLK